MTSMIWFRSDAEFWEAFNRLDALNGQSWHWETPVAKKDHEDIFGRQIKAGETYFNKQYNAGFGQTLRVSRPSMEAMLMAVVLPNGYLEAVADDLIEERKDKMRAFMAKHEQRAAERALTKE